MKSTNFTIEALYREQLNSRKSEQFANANAKFRLSFIENLRDKLNCHFLTLYLNVSFISIDIIYGKILIFMYIYIYVCIPCYIYSLLENRDNERSLLLTPTSSLSAGKKLGTVRNYDRQPVTRTSKI